VVVLDLSEASFLDSLGITTLVNLHQRSRRQQVELRVVAEPGRVARRVLSLSGVDALLAIHDSLEDARTHRRCCNDITHPPPVSSPLAQRLTK
jgi:anti-anti-sigma factor